MKKVIINLFATMTLFSCSGQTNQNNVMTNVTQSPEILFQKRDKLFLQQDDNAKYYLTSVTIEKPANYYPELDSVEFSQVEFTMFYSTSSERKLSHSGFTHIAHFAKDNDSVNYKIFEFSVLSN